MSISRRNFVVMLGCASVGDLLTGCAAMSQGEVAQDAVSLKGLGKAKGMRVGNALGIAASGTRAQSRFHDQAYRALMVRECNMIVAENETKWQALRPRPDVFSFELADEMFTWAKQQDMAIRGHTLIWQAPKWFPTWLNEHDFGANPKQEAERLLTEHIRTVCQHFGRSIYSWDVVNEAIDHADGAPRKNVLTERLGAVEQIDLAFRLAKEHAPHAQLVYNDYMSWDTNSAKHCDGVLRLLGQLKSRGTPVHALGLQSHIGARHSDGAAAATARGAQERQWRRFLDEVTGMGLDLLITEFDVHDRDLPADIAIRDSAVAAEARAYLDLTLSYRQVHDFVFWGLADHVSWLQDKAWWPRTDGLAKRPTPYDDQLRPKPMRTAIADAIRAMPMRSMPRQIT